MREVDELWQEVCRGGRKAFGDWMGRVERPIRRALEPFAAAVDAEGVLQETFMRMWLFAGERGTGLVGENASLRFAIGMARNIARNEARRNGRRQLMAPEEMPEVPVTPQPPSDPRLGQVIRDCFNKLPRRPREALEVRVGFGHTQPDRDLAAGLGMTLNTFLQNIVRARKQLARCLEHAGVRLAEVLQ